jgi:hypothetical protein
MALTAEQFEYVKRYWGLFINTIYADRDDIPNNTNRAASTYAELPVSYPTAAFADVYPPTEAQVEAVYDTVMAQVQAERDAIAQRGIDLSQITRRNVDNALQIIDTGRQANANDVAALPTATNAEIKDIVGRLLAREAEQFVLLRKMARVLAALVGDQDQE